MASNRGLDVLINHVIEFLGGPARGFLNQKGPIVVHFFGYGSSINSLTLEPVLDFDLDRDVDIVCDLFDVKASFELFDHPNHVVSDRCDESMVKKIQNGVNP
jgi:hypothetical protein